MKGKRIYLLILLAVMLILPGTSFASSKYLAPFKAKYPNSAAKLQTCSLCHTSAPALNNYGSDFATHHTGTAKQAFKAIQPLDSDGDGFKNITEINAGTMPGNINSKPAALQ